MRYAHHEAGALTLAVDCGGGGIKAAVLDEAGTLRAPALRVVTPYPLPPSRLLDILADFTERLPPADRLTIGMPGMVRHGVVIDTPHYVTRHGPRTKVVPELREAWQGFDLQRAAAARFGLPPLVLNDAEVHGAGVVSGVGLEMILTLGTGLGNAIFDGGQLAPHLELSRAQFRWGLSLDEYLGEHERLRLGDVLWGRRVRQVVESLRPVVLWDRLYIGGGNSRVLSATLRERLGEDVVIVPNSVAIVGGVRAWRLRA